MASQRGTSGAEGAHVITIGGPSLLEKGKGKLGELEEDTSAKGPYGIPIFEGPSLLEKGKGKLGELEEDTSAEGFHGIPTFEEPSPLEKMNSILSKLRKADDSEEATIFRVPWTMRESKRDMFEPSVVSIGPYYRGLPRFRAMEKKKWWFLQHFLDRNGCALQDCISKIKEVEKRARCCYSEPFDMSSNDFVEMMVLDGCFIIEYFHMAREREDLIAGWVTEFIPTDMIILENQIPFFIIETLLGSPWDPLYLEDIADVLTAGDIPIRAPSEAQKIHHLLHLCLCYAVPTRSAQNNAASERNHSHFPNWIRAVSFLKCFCSEKNEEKLDRRKVWEIPCATELEEAGVKFKKLEQSDDLTKITFQSGTLVIPPLCITDRLKPVFMNLVALEQCMSTKLSHHFSTYMMFLDCLVNTPNDVRILQNKGILESMLSGEEEVALFFNQSGVNVFIFPDHYLAKLFMRVNKYCESRYHRHRARLSRDYFNNPWSIISLIAAIVLLLLTFTQTFMAVFSYKYPPKQ